MKNFICSSFVTVAFLLTSVVAHAESVFDFEYMPSANGYESAFGIGIYQLKDTEFSFYGNVQSAFTERKPHYPNLTVASFGDPVTGTYNELLIGNVGITKKIAGNFGAYAGLGYGSATGVAKKFDPLLILGPNGTYYVNDPTNDKSGLNINAGLLVIVGKIALNAGYQSFSKTAYFGIGMGF